MDGVSFQIRFRLKIQLKPSSKVKPSLFYKVVKFINYPILINNLPSTMHVYNLY